MDLSFEDIENELHKLGFLISRKDSNRPWGGFWVIDESQTAKFAARYFPNYDLEELTKGLKVDCKILIVEPHKRLSWQYHHRRSEIWKVTDGSVGVIRSKTNDEMPLEIFNEGDVVVLEKEERHRLVGLDGWGVIAEIWQHTDPENPSDEEDIIRLQDDYRDITD